MGVTLSVKTPRDTKVDNLTDASEIRFLNRFVYTVRNCVIAHIMAERNSFSFRSFSILLCFKLYLLFVKLLTIPKFNSISSRNSLSKNSINKTDCHYDTRISLTVHVWFEGRGNWFWCIQFVIRSCSRFSLVIYHSLSPLHSVWGWV